MKAKTAPIDSARSRTEFDRATVACDSARAHQKYLLALCAASGGDK